MYQVKVNDKEYNVTINGTKIFINDHLFEMELAKTEAGQLQVRMPDKILYPTIEKGANPKNVIVRHNGQAYEIELKDHFDLLLEKMGMDKMLTTVQTDLKAPMPGLVLEVLVGSGQAVQKGEALLVLEAMKMENVIKAPVDAVVKEVSVNAKEAVEKNQVLITFE